jgi:hypothetical protein
MQEKDVDLLLVDSGDLHDGWSRVGRRQSSHGMTYEY